MKQAAGGGIPIREIDKDKIPPIFWNGAPIGFDATMRLRLPFQAIDGDFLGESMKGISQTNHSSGEGDREF